MPIHEKPLAHFINCYYGYGSWEAKIWFVGYEEGGGDLPEEVAEKVDYFFDTFQSAAEPTLADIRQVYRHVAFRAEGPKAGVYANRYEYRFGANAIKHGVWKNLILFHNGFKNEAVADVLEYQRDVFASPQQKREALIQLYPLPSPHNHAWYYSWLDMPAFPFLKSRLLYEQYVYPSRIRHLLENIHAYKPEVVLMYGMNNINTLKQSVLEHFSDAGFKMVKAIKQQIPQHHMANLHGTRLIITTQIPALRHNRAETGFDWEAFGRSISL